MHDLVYLGFSQAKTLEPCTETMHFLTPVNDGYFCLNYASIYIVKNFDPLFLF